MWKYKLKQFLIKYRFAFRLMFGTVFFLISMRLFMGVIEILTARWQVEDAASIFAAMIVFQIAVFFFSTARSIQDDVWEEKIVLRGDFKTLDEGE